MMILGHAAVRMDGDCLLLAGGEPLHGPFHPDACEAMRFCASHIEPIEDETWAASAARALARGQLRQIQWLARQFLRQQPPIRAIPVTAILL